MRASEAARGRATDAAERTSVSITRDGELFQGALWLPSGEPREVQGDSCVEVSQALALVLALDAEQGVADHDGPRIRAAHDPRPVQRAAPGRGLRARREPQGATAWTAARDRQASPRWAAGAGGTALLGPAPTALVGAVVWAERAEVGLWKPGFLVQGEGALTGTVERKQTVSRFQWWAARAMACVNAPGGATTLNIRWCATGAAGFTRAAGLAEGPIVEGRSVWQGWLSLGPALRFRFDLPGGVATELSAAVDKPFLMHDSGFSTPDVTVHRTRPWAGVFTVRLGTQWPGTNRPRAAIIQR